MFLFYHLLLAYVCAEFAFQPRELINWKKKSFWGIGTHSLIFLVISAIFCLTYLSDLIFIGFLLLLTFARTLIDYLDIKITAVTRFDNIITFLVEQFFFVAILLPAIFVPQLNKVSFLYDSTFSTIYNNSSLILYLSFFFTVIYGGSFIIYYLKKTFVNNKLLFKYDRIGMIERLLVFAFFLLGKAWLFLILLVVISKGIFLLSGIKTDILKVNEPAIQFQKIKLRNSITYDLLISPVFAVFMGIILKSL